MSYINLLHKWTVVYKNYRDLLQCYLMALRRNLAHAKQQSTLQILSVMQLCHRCITALNKLHNKAHTSLIQASSNNSLIEDYENLSISIGIVLAEMWLIGINADI